MNEYELMVIITSELGDAEVKKEIASIQKKIESFKGDITKNDFWGLKNFAYQIGKFTEGYYQLFEFSLDPKFVSELTTWLNNQDKTIIRNLITIRKKTYAVKV